MTQEDIIKLAREAGFNPVSYTGANLELFERFAALVAAHERESVAASSKRDLTCVCGAVWDGEQMVHAPRKREWVGLTDEEKEKLVEAFYGTDIQRLEAVEAKLKEKNHG